MNLPDSPSHHESASATADAQVGTVLGEYWTAGDGAAAAEEHYAAERATHQQLAEACRYIGRGYGRLGGYVRSIKRKIREAHDEAHRKIEEALRANKGLPVTVDITPILTEYRGLIDGHSAELRTFVTDETAMLGNEFKLAPPSQDGGRGTSDGEDAETRMGGEALRTAQEALATAKVTHSRVRAAALSRARVIQAGCTETAELPGRIQIQSGT